MKELLEYASKRYYEGTPIMSDAAFDALYDRYGPLDTVGYADSANTIPHAYPMFSLQKVYFGESVPPTYNTAIVTTPKLDGAAVSLLYVEGNLALAITRGDGKRGQEVTDKLLELAPRTLPVKETWFITGELAAPKTIPNARNYASGALGLKDINEFKSRDLTFIAYDIRPFIHHSWASSMQILRGLGFNTVVDSDWSQFPQDGLVVRVDSNTIYHELGFTSHHPRGAYALKERKEGVVTKLKDVQWQIGKSGVVSPVAILEPVEIDGAVVSRATLHNMKYITDLDLEIGCDVEVIRAGEIIPRVVRRV